MTPTTLYPTPTPTFSFLFFPASHPHISLQIFPFPCKNTAHLQLSAFHGSSLQRIPPSNFVFVFSSSFAAGPSSSPCARVFVPVFVIFLWCAWSYYKLVPCGPHFFLPGPYHLGLLSALHVCCPVPHACSPFSFSVSGPYYYSLLFFETGPLTAFHLHHSPTPITLYITQQHIITTQNHNNNNNHSKI